ncbi:glycosyltransferase family 2 protein [Haloarcula sp. JP-L23]|uniref:glycosyltransferase family 2 protein n=1 Tax=Haloarcula sp. JP-L23 TaxID=2716717 RepID=UPI00140F3C10|nr:glycosyltransferase family 2 protein [Haloarcula sp. JP-L23]
MSTSYQDSAQTADTELHSPGSLLGADSTVTPTVSVVMPTMNEEEGIRECIQRAKNAIEAIDVTGEVIISDASEDQTPDIAREMGATVVEPDKPGYGYAYRYAFEQARGDYLVMGDADTTYDFEELPKLLALVREEGADIAMGSRLEGTIKPEAMPKLHQYVGNPLLTKFLNVFYDADVSDAHSGFRVFTREALTTLDLDTDGMEFASEMIMDAASKNLVIKEVPITYHPREGEAKLESFHDGWRHVKFMLVNAPGYLFSVPGMVIGILGALIMGLAYAGVSLFGQTFGIHSLIAGSLLTLLGYQVGSFGLLSATAGDPIRRPDDTLTEWAERYFTLERGVTFGAGLFLVGSTMAGILIWQWFQSRFTDLPLVSADIVAFTMIVLGIQTIFGSFFMYILSDT